MQEAQERAEYTLVARKPSFGLPTGCPICLPVYIHLKLASFPFHLNFNNTFPDSDQLPYIESGTYVAYNDENGGVIERLREDGIVDLDADFCSLPEWISMKAMVSTWLAEAVMYELWVGSDGTSARAIYYSDLPWLIGKALFMKQVYVVKQRFGITKENAERKEAEIYKRAKIAYGALSTTLGIKHFFLKGHLVWIHISLGMCFSPFKHYLNHRCCDLRSWSTVISYDMVKNLSQSTWRLDHLLPSHNSIQRLHQLQQDVLQIQVQRLRSNPRGKRQKRRKLSEEGQNTF
ncbi:mitochondrial outer membrane import complex protein [Salix suchowensis]|nr:mitochondrial outer membrane import complex protein [Salix suchowensis]